MPMQILSANGVVLSVHGWISPCESVCVQLFFSVCISAHLSVRLVMCSSFGTYMSAHLYLTRLSRYAAMPSCILYTPVHLSVLFSVYSVVCICVPRCRYMYLGMALNGTLLCALDIVMMPYDGMCIPVYMHVPTGVHIMCMCVRVV